MKVVNPLLERCFQLIEFLAEEPRAYRLGVISERLGLQKGAAHRLLAALCDMGWVEQEPETGFYRLTLRLAIMGQRVLLATRPPEGAMRVVREEGFPPPGRYGPRAIQSIDAFAAAVDETRARGWGMSYEEGERGIAAIAAPIRPFGPNTPAVATCSVAGPL